MRLLVRTALRRKEGNRAFIEIAPVSDEVAQRVKQETGLDVAGFAHSLDESGVRHIFQKHGNAKAEAARGQVAVTEEDFARLPDVVAQPDKISRGRDTDDGKPTVVFEKRMGDTVYYVQEVRNRRGKLAAKTLWKARGVPPAATDVGLAQTSETPARSASTDAATVAQSADQGKAQPDLVQVSTTNGRSYWVERAALAGDASSLPTFTAQGKRQAVRVARARLQQSDQAQQAAARPGKLDFGGRSVEQLEREYAQMPGTDGGHIIDVDLVRELSPEYRADKSRAADIHEAASALSKQLLARALARPVAAGRENVAVFTAGGGGSGKSTAIQHLLGSSRSDVTLDGTLSKLEKARAQIEAALATGRRVEIRYAYRSPANATRGAIERAIASGRPVPIEVLAQAHAQSPEVVRALAREYADHKRVEIVFIHNDGASLADAFVAPTQEIPHVDEQQARQAFKDAVESAWRAAQGAAVHPDTGQPAFTERAAVSASAAQGGNAADSDALSGFTPRLYEAFIGHPPPDAQPPLLQSYDAQELARRQQEQEAAERARQTADAQAEQKARADAEVGSFTLTGSDRPADVAQAHGQRPMFSLGDDAGSGQSEADQQFEQTERAYGGEAAYKKARQAGQMNLDYRQWVQVRTPAFKAWFGDWENDPKNASKVVDPETGEPLVVYHSTDADFSVFDAGKLGANTFVYADKTNAALTAALGHWFSTADLSQSHPDSFGRSKAFFLNIRSAQEVSSLHALMDNMDAYVPVDEDGYWLSDVADFSDPQELADAGRQARQDVREAGYDGIVVEHDNEFGGSSYVALDANQIKSATDNTGAFDAGEEDIRFSLGDDAGGGDLDDQFAQMLKRAESRVHALDRSRRSRSNAELRARQRFTQLTGQQESAAMRAWAEQRAQWQATTAGGDLAQWQRDNPPPPLEPTEQQRHEAAQAADRLHRMQILLREQGDAVMLPDGSKTTWAQLAGQIYTSEAFLQAHGLHMSREDGRAVLRDAQGRELARHDQERGAIKRWLRAQGIPSLWDAADGNGRIRDLDQAAVEQVQQEARQYLGLEVKPAVSQRMRLQFQYAQHDAQRNLPQVIQQRLQDVVNDLTYMSGYMDAYFDGQQAESVQAELSQARETLAMLQAVQQGMRQMQNAEQDERD